LTQTLRELEDIFLGLGFTVLEGPEVETVHYNFDALNHGPTHPARARTDTFYLRRPRGAGGGGDRSSRVSGPPSAVTLAPGARQPARGGGPRGSWPAPGAPTCPPPPRQCRGRRGGPTRRRCTSSSPGACTGRTPTPRTPPSSIRSRDWPSTRTSRWPT